MQDPTCHALWFGVVLSLWSCLPNAIHFLHTFSLPTTIPNGTVAFYLVLLLLRDDFAPQYSSA